MEEGGRRRGRSKKREVEEEGDQRRGRSKKREIEEDDGEKQMKEEGEIKKERRRRNLTS
ncbi:hypothetical protein H6P81_002706 [Aristolochia fimbriata]|uniref:Uncharacterized protein n=1 Tax=Aristolochia fimbriata TaxID=158543 RepID=A0AAV7FAR3_ARIFI|nr:hypothetical protein H6P81_002706 [Aristolochia fimbriata]